MSQERLFLFDLDSTITRVEILPKIAELLNARERMSALTESAMQGAVPFRESFLARVEMLRELDVSRVSALVATLPVNEELADFLGENRERCYVLTGNLDVWIGGLIERLGMAEHCICSHAELEGDRIRAVTAIVDKGRESLRFGSSFVAVGDGENDLDMIRHAELGIGYGGVRPIAPSLLRCVDRAFYDEKSLVAFLRTLL